MDAALTQLFNLLPVAWQPYVVLFLIAAYVITKWRSAQKSAKINETKGILCEQSMKPNKFAMVIDFLF